MGRIKEQAQELASATKAQAPAIKELIEKNWGRIAAVAAKGMSPDRMFQFCISTINKNPKLAECTPTSVLSCFMRCSALGVEPSDVDGLGRAYILPFKNKGRMEATFILGYKGMLDLARRSGEIKDICARAVYEGDVFKYSFGLEDVLEHIPQADEKTPDKLTHAYMIAKFKGGGHYIEVMTKEEIEQVRKHSKAKDEPYGPWVNFYEQMAEKTVVKRAWPYLPLSVDAQQAGSTDETTGGFEYVFNRPVIEEPTGEPVEVPAEVHTEEKPDVPPVMQAQAHTGKAVCRTCGNTVDVAADATLEDLNQFLCCEKPDYGWA